MLVKEAMSADPKMVNAEDTINHVAEIMRFFDVRGVPVVKNGIVEGFVTDRDMVLRVLAEKRDPLKVQAREIMTEGLFVCFEKDPVEKAVQTMTLNQIGQLLVIDKDHKLVGMIALDDQGV